MKKYCYYPGCSTEATAKGLGDSIQAVAKPLEIELEELEGWTCCGAVHYGSLDRLEAIPVAAYNLALAEKTGLDLVTPCTGCFVTLTKANMQIKENSQLMSKVNQALAAAELEYRGNVKIRLLTEVLVNDVGFEFIATKIKGSLNRLRVAPYYGCQLVRPGFGFDDPEAPQKLDRLVDILGAEAVNFPMKARCCGSSLIISEEGIALELIYKLLRNAFKNGAQCIVTPCPLCQINLDAYQSKVNRRFKSEFKLPVLFVTQLIGLALGIDAQSLGLNTNIVSPGAVLEHISRQKQGVASGT
jgi:heterodisulfide reductase subunit B